MNNKIQEVINIFEEIKNNSSRNDKEGILKRNIDNQLFKDMLFFLYNPYIVTGVAKKKLSKFINTSKNSELKDIYELMDYLNKNNTGKDENIIEVCSFINSFPEEIKYFLQELVTKDYKCGLTSKTINKVYGENFIPSFDVMLAQKYQDNLNKIKGIFILTQKLDGNRLILLKEDGKIEFRTRQGQIVEGLKDLEIESELLPDNYAYDGEILLKNENNLDSKELFQATMKEVRKKGNKKKLEFYCFDILPIDEFKQGKSKANCLYRKNQLHNILTILNLQWIKEVEMLYAGEDKSQIEKFLRQAIERGEEGVMVNLDLPYECKRTSNILKVKEMQSCDCKVTGFQEGEGNFKGTLGALFIDYKGYKVKVGSGFTEKDREEIWNSQDKYLGKIIEVQYFEQTHNQEGGTSLRFPVFKCFRDDKTEPSYN